MTIEQLEEMAKAHDGHVSILKFTTGYKVVFGTPRLTEKDSGVLRAITSVKSLTEALRIAEILKPEF